MRNIYYGLLIFVLLVGGEMTYLIWQGIHERPANTENNTTAEANRETTGSNDFDRRRERLAKRIFALKKRLTELKGRLNSRSAGADRNSEREDARLARLLKEARKNIEMEFPDPEKMSPEKIKTDQIIDSVETLSKKEAVSHFRNSGSFTEKVEIPDRKEARKAVEKLYPHYKRAQEKRKQILRNFFERYRKTGDLQTEAARKKLKRINNSLRKKLKQTLGEETNPGRLDAFSYFNHWQELRFENLEVSIGIRSHSGNVEMKVTVFPVDPWEKYKEEK